MTPKKFVYAFYAFIILAVFVVFISIGILTNKPIPKFKVIKTNDGEVKGMKKTTLIEKLDFYSFKGIRYAKSPTGELRFKPPSPVTPWKPNVLEAFEHGPICMQIIIPYFGDVSKQSEDCLFLNIYAPADVKYNEKLAVMVYIHGGGYSSGSGNDDFAFAPDFLLEQRVIVVTLNYRLGLLGFLSLGTPEYSGNMGLKDQQMALKWIHSNIEHFSGDKNRITVFGESAGSASAHFQIFSEESRKYIRNFIAMSGSVDMHWAVSSKSENLDAARIVAEESGEQPNLSVEELIEFFESSPSDDFAQYGNLESLMKRTFELVWAPVVERKDAVRPFIVDYPSKIYEESNISIDALFTFTEYEFITFFTKVAAQSFDIKGLDSNFSLVLPFKDVNLAFDSQEYQNIASEIREFYFKNASIDEKTLRQYINLFSDVNFAYGAYKSAQQHAMKSKSNSYFLRFGVDSKLNIAKTIFMGPGNISGAGHADDICYVFRCNGVQKLYDAILENKDDEQSKIVLQTIENMTKLFANFAKYGSPTHNDEPGAGFLPITPNGQVNFLDVTNDGLKVGVNPNSEANQLWARIEQRIQQINTEAGK